MNYIGLKSNIKVICIIFMMFIMSNFILLQSKANAEISFSVDSLNDVEKSSNITVNIKGENFENASKKPNGIKFDLFYDSSLLEFVSAQKGDAVSSAIDLNENYTDEGRVRIGIVSLTSINKSGIFYQVTFKVKDNISVNSSDLKLEMKEVSNSSGEELETTAKNGVINFKRSDVQKSEETEDGNSKNNSSVRDYRWK